MCEFVSASCQTFLLALHTSFFNFLARPQAPSFQGKSSSRMKAVVALAVLLIVACTSVTNASGGHNESSVVDFRTAPEFTPDLYNGLILEKDHFSTNLCPYWVKQMVDYHKKDGAMDVDWHHNVAVPLCIGFDPTSGSYKNCVAAVTNSIKTSSPLSFDYIKSLCETRWKYMTNTLKGKIQADLVEFIETYSGPDEMSFFKTDSNLVGFTDAQCDGILNEWGWQDCKEVLHKAIYCFAWHGDTKYSEAGCNSHFPHDSWSKVGSALNNIMRNIYTLQWIAHPEDLYDSALMYYFDADFCPFFFQNRLELYKPTKPNDTEYMKNIGRPFCAGAHNRSAVLACERDILNHINADNFTDTYVENKCTTRWKEINSDIQIQNAMNVKRKQMHDRYPHVTDYLQESLSLKGWIEDEICSLQSVSTWMTAGCTAVMLNSMTCLIRVGDPAQYYKSSSTCEQIFPNYPWPHHDSSTAGGVTTDDIFADLIDNMINLQYMAVSPA